MNTINNISENVTRRADKRSIFIPHVFGYITKETVVEILQKHYNLGTICKMECIPKVNQTDYHEYYSCYVFFEFWTNDANASYILSRLEKNLVSRLKYSGEKYWQICLNVSEIAFYDSPKHFDLVLYLHPDISKATILTVIESLDIGKVDSIEIEQSDTNDPICKYQEKVMWQFANPTLWTKKMDFNYNTVKIRFEFWYRTKTTYAFQNSIYHKQYIDIPVFEGIWTFFSEKPKFEGINPNVWIK